MIGDLVRGGSQTSSVSRMGSTRSGVLPRPSPLGRAGAAVSLLVALAVLALAVLGPAAAPAAAEGGCEVLGGSGCGLSGQYSGTWEAEKVEMRTKQSITRKVKLTWSEGFDGQYWVLASAGGSFSCESVGEFGDGGCAGSESPKRRTCSGTLSLAAGGAAAFRQTQVEHAEQAGLGGFGAVPYISHNDPGGTHPVSPSTWYVSVAPPLRSTLLLPGSKKYEELLHSSETEAESPCASSSTERKLDGTWSVPYGQWANSFGGAECHYVGEDGIDWESFPAGSTYTVADNCSGSATEGSIFGKATLTQSVTLGSPGLGSGVPGGGSGSPPTYGPELSTAKREVLRDLREEAIPNAVHYCLPVAAGTLAVPFGLVLFGGGAGAGITVVAGGLTAATLSPYCQATIKRLIEDWKGYRDPPLSSIGVLARPASASASVAAAALPSCKRWRGRALSLCKKLRSAGSKLVAAAGRSAAVAEALNATISREHAAFQARNAAAIAAQDANLKVLLGEQRGASAAERVAGRAVAKALRSAGLRFRITRKQSAKVTAAAVRGAARQGVSAADLRSVNPGALKPAAVNLLTDLERL
jgi:hypothetical protein